MIELLTLFHNSYFNGTETGRLQYANHFRCVYFLLLINFLIFSLQPAGLFFN